MKRPIFDIRLRRNARNENFFVLKMSPELNEYFGEKPVCQKCRKYLEEVFYVCEEYFKWFCRDCQLKEGELKRKDILCDFDLKQKAKTSEEHHHICIKEIDYEKDE